MNTEEVRQTRKEEVRGWRGDSGGKGELEGGMTFRKKRKYEEVSGGKHK